jgi:hypothetical protein
MRCCEGEGEGGVERSTILETGEVFHASFGTGDAAHRVGDMRILVGEAEASVRIDLQCERCRTSARSRESTQMYANDMRVLTWRSSCAGAHDVDGEATA